MGYKSHAQRKAVWASRNEKKKGSPAKHCASDMMHSGGWQEMRKHNSPGTIGNKAGIKHNEKMRAAIGTFKMPHQSPLSNTEQDSVQAKKAWDKMKADYLKKPNGEKEYNMEKGEFYYDVNKKKMRLIPTDDAEEKDLTGIKKWQLAPNRKSSIDTLKIKPTEVDLSILRDKLAKKVDYNQPSIDESWRKIKLPEPSTIKIPEPSTIDTVQRGFKQMVNTPELDKVEKPVLSPLNKEGKKDACYYKVKSRVKVWPSAYASGQLVQCREAGAANWGEKSKKK